jgi:Flp pilus assembly pilin Flp
MTPKKFLKEEKGVVAMEYVIFVAAIGIILAAGVAVLYNSMGTLFAAWGSYFAGS